MRRFLLGGLVFLALLAIGACEKYPGRARASDAELAGTYVTSLNQGTEKLTLLSDKAYIQNVSSAKRQFTNRGTWKATNMFLSGTEIELNSFYVSENDPSDSPQRYGTLSLQVHREGLKLKLARNEAFDWYYDRLD